MVSAVSTFFVFISACFTTMGSLFDHIGQNNFRTGPEPANLALMFELVQQPVRSQIMRYGAWKRQNMRSSRWDPSGTGYNSEPRYGDQFAGRRPAPRP